MAVFNASKDNRYKDDPYIEFVDSFEFLSVQIIEEA